MNGRTIASWIAWAVIIMAGLLVVLPAIGLPLPVILVAIIAIILAGVTVYPWLGMP